MGSSEQEFRAQAAAHRAEAAASFERCDTDGFLSQWASGLSGQLADRKADIAAAGGTAVFARWILCSTETGAKIDAKIVETRFGTKFRIDATDEWISIGMTAKGLARKGYELGEEIERAAAFAFMNGQGTGLSGSAWVSTAREGARKSDGWRCIGTTDAEQARYEEQRAAGEITAC